MKTKTLHKFNILILFSLWLVSCNAGINKPGDCPASFDSYAYSDIVISDTMPLSNDWEKIATIPDEINSTWLGVSLIRKLNNQTEIWLKGPDSNVYLNRKSKDYNYYVYNLEKREWRTISAVVDSTNAFAMRLFLTHGGTVWAQNFWDVQDSAGNLSSYQRYPILSKFNDTKQVFEPIAGTQGINAFNRKPGTVEAWNKVLYSDGIFWIIAQNDAIYSYDPATSKMIKHLEVPNLEVQDATFSKDSGYIYLQVEHGITFSFTKGEYLQYIPIEDKLIALDAPKSPWPDSSSMLIDDVGNLWLSAVGWRSPAGDWHLLYPNPVLYFWNMQIEGNDNFQLPNIILESADGRLWFAGSKGLAWLDPVSMQGCWFTNCINRSMSHSKTGASRTLRPEHAAH